MDNPEVDGGAGNIERAQIVTSPLPDFDNMSDREILIFIASNMITPDSIVTTIETRLPALLSKLESNPLVKTLLPTIVRLMK